MDDLITLKDAGNDFYRSKLFDKAIDLYIRAYKKAETEEINGIDEYRSTICFNIGQSYFAKDNFSEASRFYDKAIFHNKKNFKAFFKKVLLFDSKARFLDAFEILLCLSETPFNRNSMFREKLAEYDRRLITDSEFQHQILNKTLQLLKQKNDLQRKRTFLQYSFKALKYSKQTFPQIAAISKIIFEHDNLSVETRSYVLRSLIEIFGKNKQQNLLENCNIFLESLLEDLLNSLQNDSQSNKLILSDAISFCLQNSEFSKMEDIFRKLFLPVSKISTKTNSILEICLKSLIKNLTKSLKLKEDILINSDFFDKIISEFSNRFEETQSNEQLFKTFLSSVVISNDNNKMLSEVENTKMATIHKKYFESCNRAIINFIESGTLETAMSLLLLVTRATPSVGIKIANQKQILQAAVDISHDKSNKIWLSAAEILALGCSNKQIRLTIVDAELYQMFAELLLQNFAEKTVYADKDNIAKAKTTSVALLALSKLTAMSQKVKDFVLNFRLSGNGENPNIEPLAIVAAFSVLEKLKNSEEQIVSDIVEAISFLSVHIEIKQIICNNTQYLKLLSETLLKHNENSLIRYGVLQTFLSFTMSSGDYDNLLSENSETEELGKAIRKGLEKNKKDFFESVSENAGTAEQIETLREKLIATKIAISVSSICHKTSFIKLEQNSEQKKDFYENRNSKNEDKSLLSNSKFSNFALAQTLILILHNLAVPQLSRGALAQQGGVSALLSLWRNCKNEKLSRLSANGISKLICSTNPNLLKFKQSFECARAIISTLENPEHELEQFEALRALTNIASVGEEERSRLIENGVWERAKEGLFCENFRVQRSAIELMANLLLCEKGLQKMADSPAELKIFELFCKSDDFKSQSAAVRVLAFVGYQKPLLIKNGGLDKSVFERMAESEDGSVRGFAKEVAELI